MDDVLLDIRGLHVYYGGLHALAGIDLAVTRGESVVVLGANGAGKTTLLNAIAGVVSASAGHVRYRGLALDHADLERRVRMGIALVPEGRRIFTELTVRENLELARSAGRLASFTAGLDRTYEMFPALRERGRNLAGTLSGGERQMLVIARALLTDPELLMLDEPSTGLAPRLVRQVYEALHLVRGTGSTLLIVEQDVVALDVATRVFVMRNGAIVDSGVPADFRDRSRLAAAYLGGAAS